MTNYLRRPRREDWWQVNRRPLHSHGNISYVVQTNLTEQEARQATVDLSESDRLNVYFPKRMNRS